jgi:hypothetical protein
LYFHLRNFSIPSRLPRRSHYIYRLAIVKSLHKQTNDECLQGDSQRINYALQCDSFGAGWKCVLLCGGYNQLGAPLVKSSIIFESGASLPVPLSFSCPNHTLFVRERACFLRPRYFCWRAFYF